MSDRLDPTRLILTALLLGVIGFSGVVNHAAASAEQVVWALECDSSVELQAHFELTDPAEDALDCLIDGVFIPGLGRSLLSTISCGHSFISSNVAFTVIRGPPA